MVNNHQRVLQLKLWPSEIKSDAALKFHFIIAYHINGHWLLHLSFFLDFTQFVCVLFKAVYMGIPSVRHLVDLFFVAKLWLGLVVQLDVCSTCLYLG